MRKQRFCCWRKEPVNIGVSFLLDQRVEELINALKGMASFGQTPTTPHEIPQWLIKFIAAAYGCSAKCTDFTTARITLFNALIKKKADTDINRFLPPTAQALLPHLQRAALQTFISRQCCTPPPINVPNATNFGWQREGSMLLPVAMSECYSSDVNHEFAGTTNKDDSSSSDDETSSGTESDSQTSADVTTDCDSN
jgi:hypothetical protein